MWLLSLTDIFSRRGFEMVTKSTFVTFLGEKGTSSISAKKIISASIRLRPILPFFATQWICKPTDCGICGASHRRSPTTAPDTEVAQGRSVGGWTMVKDGGRNATRVSYFSCIGEHLPALCLGPVGEKLAEKCSWGRYHRSLRR